MYEVGLVWFLYFKKLRIWLEVLPPARGKIESNWRENCGEVWNKVPVLAQLLLAA